MDWTEPAAGILNSVVADQFLLAVSGLASHV